MLFRSTGERISIKHTRAMIRAALSGQLETTEWVTHPIFNLSMPLEIEGVPARVLNPRESWADGSAYDAQAQRLAAMFHANFKQFEEQVSSAVVTSGPRVA